MPTSSMFSPGGNQRSDLHRETEALLTAVVDGHAADRLVSAARPTDHVPAGSV